MGPLGPGVVCRGSCDVAMCCDEVCSVVHDAHRAGMPQRGHLAESGRNSCEEVRGCSTTLTTNIVTDMVYNMHCTRLNGSVCFGVVVGILYFCM